MTAYTLQGATALSGTCRAGCMHHPPARRQRPSSRLSNADDVQNEKQRHGKGRNQAKREDGHGYSRNLIRAQESGRRCRTYGRHQIEHSQHLPGDESYTVRTAGEFQSNKRRRYSNYDIALTSRQCEDPRQNSICVKNKENIPGNSPALDHGQ